MTKTPEEVERALNRIKGLQDITDDYLISGLEIMFDLAKQIENRGTRVILFATPGEEVVRNSHYYSILRQQFAHTESLQSTVRRSHWLLLGPYKSWSIGKQASY